MKGQNRDGHGEHAAEGELTREGASRDEPWCVRGDVEIFLREETTEPVGEGNLEQRPHVGNGAAIVYVVVGHGVTETPGVDLGGGRGGWRGI